MFGNSIFSTSKIQAHQAFTVIDTHVHILPGIDDGPSTIQESLALAQQLVQEGVRMAVATPHYNDEFPQRSAQEIQACVQELQQQLDLHTINLQLFVGHEVLIKPGLVEDIQMGRLATLNRSRYLLLELWNGAWIPETERTIFNLRAHGYIPIIAHPERHYAIQQDAMNLAKLIRMGALAQITIGSLIGMQGKTARHCAETLLKKKLVHCLASDAHGAHRRSPHILEGLNHAQKLLGRERVEHMVGVVPSMILRNELYLH